MAKKKDIEQTASNLGQKILELADEMSKPPHHKFNVIKLFQKLKQQGVVKGINDLEGELLSLEKKGKLILVTRGWYMLPE